MKLPLEVFLSRLETGKVYYFESKQISSDIPHYFICIAKTEENKLILLCCTSDRQDKNKRFIELKGWHQTLVWIAPSNENGFTKDTFVNCNTTFSYSISEFEEMYQKDIVEYKGEISKSHLSQILIGIQESPLLEQEIKQIITISLDKYLEE